MFDFLKMILLTIGFAAIIFLGYTLLSRYVFSRVVVNKWILLVVSIVLFASWWIIPNSSAMINIPKMFLMAIAAIIFFWFLDVQRSGNPRIKKAAKKVVIKPKAKPNRVKNNKK